jgi:hypothetical protein
MEGGELGDMEGIEIEERERGSGLGGSKRLRDEVVASVQI